MFDLPSQVFCLLRDHCTGDHAGNQATFVNKVNEILSGSRLREWSSDEAWAISWDKPLYSNEKASVASRVRGHLAPRWFSTPNNLPPDATDFKGLRNPPAKFQRIGDLGRLWDEFYAAHKIAATKSLDILARNSGRDGIAAIRELIGAPGYAKRDPAKLFYLLQRVHGIGRITSLHILMDLGYPVYKPDRWLVRFAAADRRNRAELERRSGTTLERMTQSYLERHLDVTFHAVDILEEQYSTVPQPVDVLDLRNVFLRKRFCDLMLAKFGMEPEDTFGIKVSGAKRILDNPSIAQHFPDLVPIAQAMARTAQEERAQKRLTSTMKKSGKTLCKSCGGWKERSDFAVSSNTTAKSHRARYCTPCGAVPTTP